jgi:predicted HicB family RNase H-like nuclease
MEFIATILVRMKNEQCTKQIVIRIPPALHDRIEAAAAVQGRSKANMARRLLENAVEREGEQGRAA